MDNVHGILHLLVTDENYGKCQRKNLFIGTDTVCCQLYVWA